MKKLKNEELNRLSNEDFKEVKKQPISLVLDDIRSMNNVGSVFRTSDAFLIEKIYLCGITATPPHREINKTALGATDTVAWEHIKDVVTLIAGLKSKGYLILSLEQADESTMLQDFQPEPEAKYALVLGNEVYGIKDEVIALSDTVLEIPQFGTKHSLNVSVSLGLALWDLSVKSRHLDW